MTEQETVIAQLKEQNTVLLLENKRLKDQTASTGIGDHATVNINPMMEHNTIENNVPVTTGNNNSHVNSIISQLNKKSTLPIVSRPPNTRHGVNNAVLQEKNTNS